MLTIIAISSNEVSSRKQKPRSLDRGLRLKLVQFRWPSVAHPYPKLLRSRCSRKAEVSGKREAWSKSNHKSLVFMINPTK
jgi:hypothetical protein